MPKKLLNRSTKPENIVEKENQILSNILYLESSFPRFLDEYFLYLKNAVSIATRYEYLRDLYFFMEYLIEKHPNFHHHSKVSQILLSEFQTLTAKDINFFIGSYCSEYLKVIANQEYLVQNQNRSLARKKSSLSVLLKFLYRNDQLPNNLSDGLNPIKLPKPRPEEIKKLEIKETKQLIEVVSTGKGLTDKEKQYWQKTKYRDKAIIMFLITYGLRLSEIQQLNLSSFHYGRSEFIIYRKRGKQSTMPLNQTILKVLKEYIELERVSISSSNQDALFLSLQNKRMTARSIQKMVKKYTAIVMGTSKENGYSPHKLRATAASSLIEFGFSIYEVQNILDHENVTTTQLYASHKKNAKKEIIKNFEWDK